MKVAFATDPGSSEKPNEDAVAATALAVAVVDGVTAPSGLNTGCIHGTPWYASNLASRVVSAVTELPGIHLRDALARALGELAASHEDTCDLSSDGTPSGTVAVLRRTDQNLEYLVLSDASIFVETRSGVITVADKSVEQLVIDLADAAKTAPVGTPERKARLDEFVTQQRKLRNVAGGYWLAGAVPEAAEHALTGCIPLAEVRRAAAMTDGASALVDLYEQLTWEQAPAELAKIGPADWIERVRRVESGDPDVTRWPRFKRGDDATIAYVEL
jgi:hypothetical protein